MLRIARRDIVSRIPISTPSEYDTGLFCEFRCRMEARKTEVIRKD
jgi:hypothetical protein